MAIDASVSTQKLVYVINVDWYFLLHWLDRSKAARDAGYEVHVATCVSADKYRQRILAEGFQLHEIAFSRRSLNLFWEVRCLMQVSALFGRLQPDVVHNITLKPVIYGGAAARWRGIPSLFSVTGLGYVFSASSLKYNAIWAVLEKALKYAFQHNTTIVSLENNHDLEQLVSRNLLANSNAVVIPGAGVDLERFQFVEEQDTQTVKVLFAGRLLMSKGLDLIVDTVRQLKGEGRAIELHVAGIIDMESRDAIPKTLLERWIYDGDFEWHGQVDDMEGLIASSNIVCLPTSYGEGIPRILIEAGAVGRAVITTDMPGCRDFVKNNIDGLLVPVNDVAALCRALRGLAEDFDLRRRFSAHARRKVEGIYSNENVIGRTLQLYEVLLSRHIPLATLCGPQSSQKFSIATVLYLTPLDFLRSHIQSVLDAVCELQRDHPCQVDFYLIDNSVDESYRTDVLALVGEWSDESSVNIELVVSGVNCGYGQGNNLVEHRLESQYHLVVNPDVILRPDALVKAFAFMASHADAGALSATVKTDVAGVAHVVKAYPDSLTLILRYLGIGRLNDLFRARLDRYACATLVDQVAVVDLIGGCFMFMRADLFRQLGGFDQRYFMYFEDFDLCRRMQPLAKVYFVPEVGISHYGGNVGRKGWRHHVYFARSAIRFFNRFGWKFW